MKTLLSSAALVAVMASGASAAGYTHWKGKTLVDTGDWNDGCTFTQNTNGTYTYDESAKTWTVTDPADVTIRVRNSPDVTIGYIQVEPVKKDGTDGGSVWSATDEWAATVLYTDSTISMPPNWGQKVDPPNPSGKIYIEDAGSYPTSGNTANPTSGIVDFDIDGTATITGFGANEIIDADTEYRTSHMITCMQAPATPVVEAPYYGTTGDAATGGN